MAGGKQTFGRTESGKTVGQRLELARQQEELLQALLRLKEAPEEVDADKVTACAKSLASKRRRAIEKCYPQIESELGEIGFRKQIAEYFCQHPSPDQCAFEDGNRFINWLRLRGGLPPDTRGRKFQMQNILVVWPFALWFT